MSLPTSCPKPAPRKPKSRRPLPPPTKRIAKSTKPIRKQNPIAKAKRVKRYKSQVIGGADYKKARAEAMERAEYQCEATVETTHPWVTNRCGEEEHLHAHHLSYPKVRKIEASDLKILCKYHHRIEEGKKLHKQGRAF